MSRPNAKTFWVRTAAIAAVALLPLLSPAAKEFVMPQAQPAKTYPAHDEHPTERVAVAVDTYDLADKAEIFAVKCSYLGFVPIFVAVPNDGHKPCQLAAMRAELVTASGTK